MQGLRDLQSLPRSAGVAMSGMIAVKLHTGLLVEHKGEEHLIADGPAVARHYMWRGTGVVDVVAMIPFWYQVL